jgi:hypothetical protein
MDLIIAALVLLIFIGLMVVAVPILNPKKSTRPVYGGEVFGNIEFGPDETAFLQDYRIDETRLSAFAALSHDEMDHLLLGNMTGTVESVSDVCVFFLNETGGMAAVDIEGRQAAGETLVSGAYSDCQWDRACNEYKSSSVHVKPVLRSGQVMNLYVAVCSE